MYLTMVRYTLQIGKTDNYIATCTCLSAGQVSIINTIYFWMSTHFIWIMEIKIWVMKMLSLLIHKVPVPFIAIEIIYSAIVFLQM